MTSTRQWTANRANALKSTGPKSSEGKRSAALNALRHGLSLPVDERLFAQEIDAVFRVLRKECDSDAQALELAKRIIDFERNEAFLMQPSIEEAKHKVDAWGEDPIRIGLIQLAQDHRSQQPVSVTFTTATQNPKGQARTDEIQFIQALLKLQEADLMANIRQAQRAVDSSLRYQKRAINQLVKGIRAVARGDEF
jgi:hypothetical protein